MLSIHLESENGIVSTDTRVLKVVFGENYTKSARFYAVYNNMPNVLGVMALYKNHRGTHHTQTIILYYIIYYIIAYRIHSLPFLASRPQKGNVGCKVDLSEC